MKKVFYLHLTGGLGNQLFQLAAGLHFAEDLELRISTQNGEPRKDKNGKPEMFSWILPSQVTALDSTRYSTFVSRVCGFIIRISANPRRFEKNLVLNFGIRFIASIINSIYFRYPVRIMKVDGVGYVGLRTNANLLIGYYQTFKYAEQPHVFRKLNSLTLENPSDQVTNLINASKDECPIIVHIRRGDYAKESGFGMLGNQYYVEAVRDLISMNKHKSIWVFSDEISKVVDVFGDNFELPIRYIGDIDESASALLEVMRYGKSYVIGNSSFSWWAAYLRYDKEAKVIAPTPWFAQQSDPNELIPRDWRRQPGHHFFISPLELERGNGALG